MICWRFRDPRLCTWKLRISPGKHLTFTSHIWQEMTTTTALLSYLEEQELSGKPVC